MKRFSFLLLMFLMLSCKKEVIHFDAGTNEAINQWIWQTMDQYYYWKIQKANTQNLSGNPLSYFRNLLQKDDRFSALVQNMNPNSYKNNFETSFGFDFIQIKTADAFNAVISLVVPGSQADELGLKRGDTILRLNDVLLNKDISGNIDQLLNGNSILLQRKDLKEFKIASAYIAQPIVYKSEILKANNKKYGYLFISHFNFAGAYDLIRIMQKFKSESITDLILDLRYNPGGQVSFAAFCALLFSKVTPDDTFLQMKGNSKISSKQYSFAKSLSEQPDGYTFKPQEVKLNSLNLSKIYILSSKQSASSSELMINNLKPYIDIIQVGETSMGKDMGSMSFSSPEDVSGKSNYKWIISPLVYKLYNSKGNGDYSTGLIPQITVSEISAKSLYPFGDAKDPLVNAILNPNAKVKGSIRLKEDKEIVYRSQRSEAMLFE